MTEPFSTGRAFYGWTIVAASAWIYSISAGLTICFGVFVKPLAAEFGWLRSEVTGAFTLLMVITGLTSIAGGFAVDRFGPRRATIAGGLLLGLGLFLASHIDALWQFYLFFSVLGGMGVAFLFVPLTATIPRWFVRSRGLALGILFAAGGIGGMILSPLVQHWIGAYGWRTSFAIVGIGAAVLILPATLFLKKDPAEIGLQPLADEVAPQAEGDATEAPVSGHGQVGAGHRSYTVREAVRSSAFWVYNLSVILMFSGIMMAQIHMVPYATDIGITASVAALALGIAAACNAVGRLVMGAVSDRIGTKRALCFSMMLAAIALFGLTLVREPVALYCAAIALGFAYGGVMPQGPKILGSLFGMGFLGGIMGVGAVFAVMGPALGPLLGALIFDRLGSYQIAFLTGGVLILAGIGLVLSLDLAGRSPAPRVGDVRYSPTRE